MDVRECRTDRFLTGFAGVTGEGAGERLWIPNYSFSARHVVGQIESATVVFVHVIFDAS